MQHSFIVVSFRENVYSIFYFFLDRFYCTWTRPSRKLGPDMPFFFWLYFNLFLCRCIFILLSHIREKYHWAAFQVTEYFWVHARHTNHLKDPIFSLAHCFCTVNLLVNLFKCITDNEKQEKNRNRNIQSRYKNVKIPSVEQSTTFCSVFLYTSRFSHRLLFEPEEWNGSKHSKK